MLAAVLFPATLSWLAAGAPRRAPIPLMDASSVDQAFAAQGTKLDAKSKLMEGLKREYESFFQPMEMDLYNPDVTFNDPMISFEGVDKYRNNVDMLAGVTMLGKLCFSDPGLAMHSVSELPDGRLQTRWTLQFRFKLLPWAPVARFTGVSRYTLDAQCRVLAQEDFWDSVNMLPGGEYAEKPKTAGLLDLLAQLAPSGGNAAQQASGKELPYVLLRRAAAKVGVAGYEVRRYPQHVSVATDYYRRLDAFGTLGAYTNGANDLQSELTPYVPSLMSVPPDERTLEQIADDSLDLKPAERPKEMRWPMAVPAMKDANPPKPNERLQDVTRLEVMPARTVAVLAFSEPTTEPNVRGFHELLKSYLKEDGLVPMAATEDEQFRLAQFDALNSFGARRSEIWIDLEEHPWK